MLGESLRMVGAKAYCHPAGGTPDTRKLRIPDPTREISQLFWVFTEFR